MNRRTPALASLASLAPALLFLAAPPLLSQEEVEFNPLGRDLPLAEMTKQLRIQVEWIEVDAAAATKLLAEPDPAKPRLCRPSDASPLRRSLQAMIDKGEAALVDSAMVSARSGQRAKVESIHEFIYPTEWDPAQFLNPDKAGGGKTVLVPPQATAFETRNVGVTLEVDPVLGADDMTIDLNLAPELVYLAGKERWGTHRSAGGEVEVATPSFYTVKTTTQVALISGQPCLLSANTPRDVETGMTDPKRKLLVFVKAEIEVVGMPEEETKKP